jgi:hypothetical protein
MNGIEGEAKADLRAALSHIEGLRTGYLSIS